MTGICGHVLDICVYLGYDNLGIDCIYIYLYLYLYLYIVIHDMYISHAFLDCKYYISFYL